MKCAGCDREAKHGVERCCARCRWGDHSHWCDKRDTDLKEKMVTTLEPGRYVGDRCTLDEVEDGTTVVLVWDGDAWRAQ